MTNEDASESSFHHKFRGFVMEISFNLLRKLLVHEWFNNRHYKMKKRNRVENVNLVNFDRRTFLNKREKFLHRPKVVSQQMSSHEILHVVKKN